MKQGLFIFLLAFLIVPLLTMISIGLRIGPAPVIFAALLLTVGGLLRAVYAYMFESPVTPGDITTANPSLNGMLGSERGLPPQRTYDASAYVSAQGSWRDTSDLEPTSVTESTTRLLEHEERH
jgi:hypothetical protein